MTDLPPAPSPPTAIPPLVYRIHRSGAQTRYSFASGFSAKNQTTILNYTSALSRFGLAHLHQQTNISSPFISVYASLTHAEAVAKYWADVWGEEVLLVTVDSRHFARGPVFRAVDLLAEEEKIEDSLGGVCGAVGKGKSRGIGMMDRECEDWLHWGEYLVMYRIPAQAIRDQTPFGRGKKEAWRAVGAAGSAH